MKNKGSIYVLTLASSLVLVAVVLGLSYQILQFRRTSRANTQADKATVYAELGIRHALHYTSVDANWRQNLNSGPWLVDIAVGDAFYSVDGIDPVDDDLANNDSDPVQITCTASVGSINRTVRVEAISKIYDQLNYAIASQGIIDVNNHVRITGNITTSVNVDKTGADTWVFGDVEAVGILTEHKNISGTITEGADPKLFPVFNTVVQYYSTRATPINFIDKIEDVLLSPTFNPYGAPNPNGLYIIQCSDQKITFTNCRIVGTLLLINPKSDSKIQDGINWRPAQPDYPALIVDGIITIDPDKDLDEGQRGVDFSLPGEPGWGSQFNVYPNEINGLIYSSSDLIVDKDFKLKGTIIADGMVELKDWASVTYDPAIITDPPIGFCQSYLVPVPGSWLPVLPPAP